METDDEDILQQLAAGAAADISAWPTLLPRVIARIEKVVHNEFPIPNLPPPSNASLSLLPPPEADISENFLAPLPSSPIEPPASNSSQDTNKENNPVAPPPPTTRPASVPEAAAPTLPPGTLPPQIAQMLAEITATLTSAFATNPPHTIQRLAELIVTPRQHYRSLHTYLHALARAIHITSDLDVYPLPSIHAEAPATLVNGAPEAAPRPSPWASPGSDEALGGALLTPIPWLQSSQQPASASAPQQSSVAAPDGPTDLEGEVRTESTETIEGPNGVGSIETVSVSVNGIPSIGARGVGVTQGELLRQEQRAGVVPISQLVPSHHVHPGHNASAAAQQQQFQVRIQHQQALAHAQSQAQAQQSTESPDSQASVTNTPSPASSATLGAEEGGDATAEPTGATTVASVHSNNAEDEEKPHARGPEEIGADDLGPQNNASTISLTTTSTGPGGVEMQGIDLQAAVGRKPLDAPSSSKTDEDDKMDVEETTRPERASTPKRDAEEPLEGGSATKKLKEDTTGDDSAPADSSAPASGDVGKPDADTTTTTTTKKTEESTQESSAGEPMEKD